MNAIYPTTTSTDLIAELRAEIALTRATIARLQYNESLGMLNAAGLAEAIRTLDPNTTYTVVFADIDRLKVLNNVTRNHLQTNRYLAAGLAVRYGEVAGQLLGDEFVFILDDQARNTETSPDGFVARIARQLAGQPLTISERYALAAAQRCHVSEARLSATFATQSGVSARQVEGAIEALSCQVLAMKSERDQKVRMV
jgi:GGDEF domain-containing protein